MRRCEAFLSLARSLDRQSLISARTHSSVSPARWIRTPPDGTPSHKKALVLLHLLAVGGGCRRFRLTTILRVYLQTERDRCRGPTFLSYFVSSRGLMLQKIEPSPPIRKHGAGLGKKRKSKNGNPLKQTNNVLFRAVFQGLPGSRLYV